MKKFFQAIFTVGVEIIAPTCLGLVLWAPIIAAPFYPEKALTVLPISLGLWIMVGIIGVQVLSEK